MDQITVTVRQRGQAYEGTFQVPGTTQTKLAKKDGSTQFSTRALLVGAANRLGRTLGITVYTTDYERVAAAKRVKPSRASSTKPTKTAQKSS